MSLARRCHSSFDSTSRSRGLDYFDEGRVSKTEPQETCIDLTVAGSGRSYKIKIDFKSSEKESILNVSCDCPHSEAGHLCKHIWAAILQIDAAGQSKLIPGESQKLDIVHQTSSLKDEFIDDELEDDFQIEREHSGLEMPPTGTRKPEVTSSHWADQLGKIAALNQASIRELIPQKSGRIPYYFLNVPLSKSTRKLVVDIWIREASKTGLLTPLKFSRVRLSEVDKFASTSDQELISLLFKTAAASEKDYTYGYYGDSASRFFLDPVFHGIILPKLVESMKFSLAVAGYGQVEEPKTPLELRIETPWSLKLRVLTDDPESYRLQGELVRRDQVRPLEDLICLLKSGYAFFREEVGLLDSPSSYGWVTTLMGPHPVTVPKTEGFLLVKNLLTNPDAPPVEWPVELQLKHVEIEPKPRALFRIQRQRLSQNGSRQKANEEEISLHLEFIYGTETVRTAQKNNRFFDIKNLQIGIRDAEKERSFLEYLSNLLNISAESFLFFKDGYFISKQNFIQLSSHLVSVGWEVFAEGKRVRNSTGFDMQVSSEMDWFDLKIKAEFGSISIGVPDLLKSKKAIGGLIELGDGTVGILPAEWISKYSSLLDLGTSEAEKLRFHKSQGILLDAWLGDDSTVKIDLGFKKFREKLNTFSGLTVSEEPTGFQGVLRPYQKEGLAWFQFLHEFHLGGILADDMGLGKTIQFLAFLKARKNVTKKATNNPSLVVVPKSLVFNWLEEARRFVPDLTLLNYTGPNRKELLPELPHANLIITTYPTLRLDLEELNKIEFDVSLIDEAQAIKNPRSQIAKACKMVKSQHRFAMTGTPIENSLSDLFSILEFTQPGLFTRSFDTDQTELLKKALRPIILRRTKKKVLQELPDKTETTIYCELSDDEQERYNELRAHYRSTLNQKIDQGEWGRMKIHILEALLRLRQAACHPGLLDHTRKAEPSAKIDELLDKIVEVLQEGHKALVFSQFTSLLEIVSLRLKHEKIKFEYLDGKTTDRRAPVNRFQNDPNYNVFLISLKAGGVGLNLTAAEYVFLLDPWWNPAVEAQAIDRAHRIGQKNKVFAYRMIARGTVEEKIVELQKNKRELADSIINEDTNFLKKMTREDLEMLLG